MRAKPLLVLGLGTAMLLVAPLVLLLACGLAPAYLLQTKPRLVLALACLAALLLTANLAIPESLIGPAGYEAIRGSMTLKEVEEIFQLPAGDYSAGRAFPVPLSMSFGMPHGGQRFYGPRKRAADFKTWKGSDWEVHVGFNHQGRVVAKQLSPLMQVGGETFPEMVRRWLGL